MTITNRQPPPPSSKSITISRTSSKSDNLNVESKSIHPSGGLSLYGINMLIKAVNDIDARDRKMALKEMPRTKIQIKKTKETNQDSKKITMSDESEYSQIHFCDYCKKRSRKTSISNNWIKCKSCKKWRHTNCERKFGFRSDIQELLKNPSYIFQCDMCLKMGQFKKGKNKHSDQY